MRLLLPVLALLASGSAFAQAPEPEWRLAVEQDILLRAWAYEPHDIRLPAGRPVRLYLVNQSPVMMDFSAAAFFRAVRMRPRDADIARNGGLHLRPGERRAIDLVAPAGRYPVHSTNLAHRALGMSAEIVVE